MNLKDKHRWPYMAGIIDGEGCLHIAKFKPYGKQWAYRLDIHVTTTSEVLAKYIVANFGGTYYKQASANLKCKDAFRWTVSGRKNKEALLLGVLPHLVIKTELAKLCLEFIRIDAWENNPEKREELMQKSRVYTRRGRSVETDTLSGNIPMIQSELTGNCESVLVGTQVA